MSARDVRPPASRRARRGGFLGLFGLAMLVALAPGLGGCGEFDTSRPKPKLGTVGEEMYGVICDRMGAQALREDLSGASFRSICHKVKDEYSDKVDEAQLPPIDPKAHDEDGKTVAVEKQQADRGKAIGRIEALARRRTELIRAFDAIFPERTIAIKDIDNGDPTKSCDAPAKGGEGYLTDQIADMLGRTADLYNDGTLPQSTESLARLIDAFRRSDDAQAAWARVSARNGYRPIETALGTVRPIIAYPKLRDFSNASLRLLSADSTPYELEPKFDETGTRVLVPGPGNAALSKMLEAAQAEMLATKVDAPLGKLTITADPLTARPILSRPRDNLEIFQEVLFASNEAFGGGPSQFIVKRDARGYAMIAGGAVPAPFVDADGDGLPDVDEVGNFKTANGSLAPSPFPFPNGANATRDNFGRATSGGRLLYEYLDTSKSFAAQMMRDMRPLVNADPAAKHETMMNMIGGLKIAMGARAHRSKSYAGGRHVDYEGIRVEDSPMLDLIYAIGVILSDRTAADTLSMSRDLFAVPANAKQTARLVGSLMQALDIAHKHPEAKLAKTSTFWDESLDVVGEIAQSPKLLKAVLQGLSDSRTENLGIAMARYANYKDLITYDRNNVNGPAYNATTKSNGEMKTPVDRGAPIAKTNRSALHRFLQAVNDTVGVTACNKQGAKIHVEFAGVNVSLPASFDECAIFKIDNLAAFYIASIANALQYDKGSAVPAGTIYMRPSALRALPGTAKLIEDSSGITGMWPTSGNIIPPKPTFLNRLVFFDVVNDTANAQTRTFVNDLSGYKIGSSTCPERVITDPDPTAADASKDGKVHGLRNCPEGQWLTQRDPYSLFALENFGFYDAISPLAGAFVAEGKADLFVRLAAAAGKAWPAEDAPADECKIPGGGPCPRAGMVSYEPLIAETFATDVLPALSQLAKTLDTMKIVHCVTTDANGVCTNSVPISGIDVVVNATVAAIEPTYSKNAKLTDRRGAVTAKRNDGKLNPQVTPAYLLTAALNGIDEAFDTYEQQNPNDKDRRTNWRAARSQLVDQFLSVNGIKGNSTFVNPTMTTMTPVIVDVLRAQLFAHCPTSFAAPAFKTCTWARQELAQHAEETIGGPLMANGLDVMDAIRADPEGRRQTELLLTYLLDQASRNDALASLLASTNDILQILKDDENMVPLFHVASAAMGASEKDDKGHVTKKSLIDAQTALLARLSGRYFDKDGKEICSKEVDPNQVLAVALGNLVTPIKNGEFKGQSPLEVIMDVIADVNRVDPTKRYEGTLEKSDYNSVSDNVVDFLMNKERGLEQFYELIRNGTRF